MAERDITFWLLRPSLEKKQEQKVARWLLVSDTCYIYTFLRNGIAPCSSRPKPNDVKNQKHISLTPILELSLNAFGGFGALSDWPAPPRYFAAPLVHSAPPRKVKAGYDWSRREWFLGTRSLNFWKPAESVVWIHCLNRSQNSSCLFDL